MKLLELLIKHDLMWPNAATHVVQDIDGEIKFSASGNDVYLSSGGVWLRPNDIPPQGVILPLASDWDTAVISYPKYVNAQVRERRAPNS